MLTTDVNALVELRQGFRCQDEAYCDASGDCEGFVWRGQISV